MSYIFFFKSVYLGVDKKLQKNKKAFCPSCLILWPKFCHENFWPNRLPKFCPNTRPTICLNLIHWQNWGAPPWSCIIYLMFDKQKKKKEKRLGTKFNPCHKHWTLIPLSFARLCFLGTKFNPRHFTTSFYLPSSCEVCSTLCYSSDEEIFKTIYQ